MSRIVAFGRDQKAEGEITAMLDRGWMLAGNPAVTGGGSTTLTLTAEQAVKPFLQLGRMVLVEHAKLPNWAGMIDTPWTAQLPVQTAVYNAEYLLSLRSPETPTVIEGSVGYIAARMIDMLNAEDDLFVRIGDVSQADPTPRPLPLLDSRTYWEQLSELVQRSGCEMRVRPEKDASGRLIIYLDIATRIGVDTGFLLSDGKDGNAVFREPVLDEPVINRVVGTGDEAGQTSRLETRPFFDQDSISIYRMRSQKVQFRDVREISTLEQYTQNYMIYSAYPRFSFLVDVKDKGDAWFNMRLGNSALAHFSEAYLPGGVRGFRGTVRILAMAISESENNLLTVKVGSV